MNTSRISKQAPK